MSHGLAKRSTQAGLTLVELVVTIVVLAVALTGVLLVINYTTSRSADPMLQQQAVAIAESYLEEILLRAYDEDGVPETTQTEGAWGAEPGETRGDFDDVNDYDGLLDNGARGQDGLPIASLSAYRVQVAVTPLVLWAVPMARLAVSVNHSAGVNLTLTGYRASY